MLLYLSTPWSDRDEAPLHKVAGRTGAGAQRHSTSQQSHRALGTHSSLHRLPATYFLYLFPSAHSLISLNLAIFFLFPLLLSLLSFIFFLPTHSSPPSLSLWESDASYFPAALWDHAEREAERAVLSKSLVVLIDCIILLMFCHCCCTLLREAVLEQQYRMYVLRKVSKKRKKKLQLFNRTE